MVIERFSGRASIAPDDCAATLDVALSSICVLDNADVAVPSGRIREWWIRRRFRDHPRAIGNRRVLVSG